MAGPPRHDPEPAPIRDGNAADPSRPPGRTSATTRPAGARPRWAARQPSYPAISPRPSTRLRHVPCPQRGGSAPIPAPAAGPPAGGDRPLRAWSPSPAARCPPHPPARQRPRGRHGVPERRPSGAVRASPRPRPRRRDRGRDPPPPQSTSRLRTDPRQRREPERWRPRRRWRSPTLSAGLHHRTGPAADPAPAGSARGHRRSGRPSHRAAADDPAHCEPGSQRRGSPGCSPVRASDQYRTYVRLWQIRTRIALPHGLGVTPAIPPHVIPAEAGINSVAVRAGGRRCRSGLLLRNRSGLRLRHPPPSPGHPGAGRNQCW